MYSYLIFKINFNNDSSILSDKINLDLYDANDINLPLLSLGFHHFIHRTRSGMNITKKLQSSNEFYYIVNPFEYIIPDYNDSLNNISIEYFNIKDNIQNIISNNFYKLWEMIFIFNICDNNLDCLIINDIDNGFLQSIINYKQKISNISKDKISVTSTNNLIDNLENDLIKKYNKQYSNLINTKINNDSNKNLILANGTLNIDDNFEEQKNYTLIFTQILLALKNQGYEGTFIFRVFDMFTLSTIKLIYILFDFYEDIYIYKPHFSRISNTEKYIICKKFKYKNNNKELKFKIDLLEKLFKKFNSNKYIYDIFISLNLPNEYINTIKYINIKLVNQQQIMINNIIKYIKENNYFGDKYHTYRENQIKATLWWTKTFYPPSNNLFIKNKEEIHNKINHELEKYNMDLKNFTSVLIKYTI